MSMKVEVKEVVAEYYGIDAARSKNNVDIVIVTDWPDGPHFSGYRFRNGDKCEMWEKENFMRLPRGTVITITV